MLFGIGTVKYVLNVQKDGSKIKLLELVFQLMISVHLMILMELVHLATMDIC